MLCFLAIEYIIYALFIFQFRYVVFYYFEKDHHKSVCGFFYVVYVNLCLPVWALFLLFHYFIVFVTVLIGGL